LSCWTSRTGKTTTLDNLAKPSLKKKAFQAVRKKYEVSSSECPGIAVVSFTNKAVK